ncbi:MAG: 3-hydroxyisobutyrate dehydrogenase [Rhodospirillales bacterium]|nr:3-hydroxyisobutyrate dehydrogenase [Rhodospirillales bacterium]
MARIGFIGLGNMGAPMAANLLKAGHAVAGCDLNADAVAALVAAGGSAAASPAEAAAGAEIVITMLPAGAHVRGVYLHQGGLIEAIIAAGARPLLIDCSTIDVASAREVAEAAAKAGLAMLDAPVSGGTTGAAAGTLTFMVGGAAADFAAGQPILAAMGRAIVHAGGPGAGQAAKICNNMMLGINMQGVAEAFVLADRLGLDRERLFAVASQSSGQSWALTSYCPVPGPVPASPANRDYKPGFAAALMLKDMRLAEAAAAATATPAALGALAAGRYQAMVDAGQAGRDFSAVFPFLAAQKKE